MSPGRRFDESHPGAPQPDVQLGMARPEAVSDDHLKVGNASAGGLIATEVLQLRSRWQRLRLGWRVDLRGKRALWVCPAPMVHSWGAPRPLRALQLDQALRLIREDELRPWRQLRTLEEVFGVLLLDAGNRARAAPGDQLEWLPPQPRLPDRADWLEEGAPPGA